MFSTGRCPVLDLDLFRCSKRFRTISVLERYRELLVSEAGFRKGRGRSTVPGCTCAHLEELSVECGNEGSYEIGSLFDTEGGNERGICRLSAKTDWIGHFFANARRVRRDILTEAPPF